MGGGSKPGMISLLYHQTNVVSASCGRDLLVMEEWKTRPLCFGWGTHNNICLKKVLFVYVTIAVGWTGYCMNLHSRNTMWVFKDLMKQSFFPCKMWHMAAVYTSPFSMSFSCKFSFLYTIDCGDTFFAVKYCGELWLLVY